MFTLNATPGLWKFKLFMEGISKGYWKKAVSYQLSALSHPLKPI
jgi:hypothetical protein